MMMVQFLKVCISIQRLLLQAALARPSIVETAPSDDQFIKRFEKFVVPVTDLAPN